MSTQKNLITLCIATVFTLGLAACGGGGGGGSSPVTTMDDDTPMVESPMIAGQTVPSGTTVTLPAGTDAPTVTFSADMDETITVADLGTFTCLTAEGCSVAVAGDMVTTTGDIEVVSLAVTDADILGQLVAAIAAGEAPKPVDVDLAALTAGYELAAGTVDIPAGGTVDHGDVALTCSGAEACTVTVADDGTVTSLGGTVTAANSPLYAANAGLDAANARIGSADDPMSLEGMLAAATAELVAKVADIETLMTTLGDGTDPDADSVRGMLAAAVADAAKLTADIGTAEDPMSLTGMLAAEKAKVVQLTEDLAVADARIRALETGTADDQLDPVRMAAMSASGDAATAETAADDAADEAEAAMANRATMQTGTANSVADAYAARAAANTAMEEAAKALAAYEAAKMAGNVAGATTERDNAVDAKDLAEAAATTAGTARDDAVADSMVELKIDGTVKSVGTAMVDLEAAALRETKNEVTKMTGKIAEITAMSEVVESVMNVGATQDVNEARPGVDALRLVNIGLVVDSDNDDARVALIKSYIGERTVGGYMEGSGILTANKSGVVTFDGNGDSDDQDFRLRSAGEHFQVTGLDHRGTIAVGTENGVAVFSYTYKDDNDVEQTGYVRHGMTTTTTVDGVTTTTYTYQLVNVVKGIPLPHGTDYDHIHYGVWASLSENDDLSGDQEVAELGIGFVQNFAGGPTEEMPNNGTGKYEGNWIANIQEADGDGDGLIRREDGVVMMMANFRMGMVDVNLIGLAELEAEITDNTFAGTEDATVAAPNTYGLVSTGDFEGTVNGGFYGPEAGEAGGVFDYASEDNEDGAFRGAFGGRRTD